MTAELTIIEAIMYLGMVFNILGVIGILRFPDVYTRLHAATKCTTLGSILVCISVISYAAVNYVNAASTIEESENITLGVHSFIALVCLLVTNPVGAHAIARAAHRSGIKPWGAVIDELSGEEE